MTEELGNVCGTCWHCCKDPYKSDWLCLYSWHDAKEVKYTDSCDKYQPRRKCLVCKYKGTKPTKEPCNTCIYVGNWFKPIDE